MDKDGHKLFLVDGVNGLSDNTIFVDLDVHQIDGIPYKCFGNHITLLSGSDEHNVNSMNLNNTLSLHRFDYTYKYNLSTALLIYSLYGIPLPESKKGKAVLCLIDSIVAAFYHDNEDFKQTAIGWLDLLRLSPLVDFMDAHINVDFEQYRNNLKSHGKIKVKDGFLHTEIKLNQISEALGFDVSLPTENFLLFRTFDQKVLEGKDIPRTKNDIGNVSTNALINFNKLLYSVPASLEGSDPCISAVETLEGERSPIAWLHEVKAQRRHIEG